MTAQVQTLPTESTSLFSPAAVLTETDEPQSKRPTVNNGISLQDLVGSKGTNHVTVAVIGAGQRGLVRLHQKSRRIRQEGRKRNADCRVKVYTSYALEHPELVKVVAIAEPRAHRRKVMSRLHSCVPHSLFTHSFPLSL